MQSLDAACTHWSDCDISVRYMYIVTVQYMKYY